MFTLFKSLLLTWGNEKNQRIKLQQLYIILTFIGLAVAGLLTLLNASLAHLAASFSGMMIVAFLINAISWGLLEAFILPHLPKQTVDKKKKK